MTLSTCLDDSHRATCQVENQSSKSSSGDHVRYVSPHDWMEIQSRWINE